MKPQLLKINNSLSQSFSVRRDTIPFFNNKWHYHPELELIFIKKGRGTQFVGDHIKPFQDGDIILIGPHLPHFWRFELNESGTGMENLNDIIVTHFFDDFWGRDFLALPELKMARTMLERAKYGLQVKGKTRAEVSKKLEQLTVDEDPFNRLLLLMQALQAIARSSDTEILSSAASTPEEQQLDNAQLTAVFNYSQIHYMNKITLNEISQVANVSPNSFCRFFKARTGKTYFNFLVEYRIGLACKLLIQSGLTIQQVCYESGFNSLGGFYKYFKKITGKTPQLYKEAFLRA